MLIFCMGKREARKFVETLGHVMVAQVPMIVTFDRNHAEFIGEHLGNSIEKAYQVISMFGDSEEGFDPFDE